MKILELLDLLPFQFKMEKYGWKVDAQFEENQPPTISIIDPENLPCTFKATECIWLESVRTDDPTDTDNLLFEREVKRISKEQDCSGFHVEKKDEKFILTFGHNLHF